MTPIYADLKTWSKMTCMNRSAIFTALARKELTAIKLGRRTLIEVEPGLAWLESLPKAEIRLPPQHAAA
jgi:hypothetical protein